MYIKVELIGVKVSRLGMSAKTKNGNREKKKGSWQRYQGKGWDTWGRCIAFGSNIFQLSNSAYFGFLFHWTVYPARCYYDTIFTSAHVLRIVYEHVRVSLLYKPPSRSGMRCYIKNPRYIRCSTWHMKLKAVMPLISEYSFAINELPVLTAAGFCSSCARNTCRFSGVDLRSLLSTLFSEKNRSPPLQL